MNRFTPTEQAKRLNDAVREFKKAKVQGADCIITAVDEVEKAITPLLKQDKVVQEKERRADEAQTKAELTNAELANAELAPSFFKAVRKAAQQFWDAVESAALFKGNDPRHDDYRAAVLKFEDTLIRYGYPLTIDPHKAWKEAAQDFVPGLDRLIRCVRTSDRRKGLRVLQRTLRDTEVGLYDGQATTTDLLLMNTRREVAGHALAWLLNQPCQPCRPTDALRREVALMTSMLEANPIGEPEFSYIDTYEEEELLSTIRQTQQAPPMTNPDDPNTYLQRPLRTGVGGGAWFHELIDNLSRKDFGVPPTIFPPSVIDPYGFNPNPPHTRDNQ